jgi:hypothetical protein
VYCKGAVFFSVGCTHTPSWFFWMDPDDQLALLTRLPLSKAQLHTLLIELGFKPLAEEFKEEDQKDASLEQPGSDTVFVPCGSG